MHNGNDSQRKFIGVTKESSKAKQILVKSSSIRKDGVKCCTLSGRGKSAKLRLSNKEKTGKKAKSFYGKIVLDQKFTL